MKYIVIPVLAILLSACAIWAPGTDPKGKKIVFNANNVLVALNKYVNENAKHPGSLNELVPNYIETLPEEPLMYYRADEGSIFFTYSPSWPQLGNVACGATIGQKSVNCNGYI